MSQASSQCSNCSLVLNELPEFAALIECPKCGSVNRLITVNDTLKIHEQGKLTAKE